MTTKKQLDALAKGRTTRAKKLATAKKVTKTTSKIKKFLVEVKSIDPRGGVSKQLLQKTGVISSLNDFWNNSQIKSLKIIKV